MERIGNASVMLGAGRAKKEDPIDFAAGIILHKKLGDFVEKGTKIGEVGTTGLSTGNHLHFGITVGGIFTDPMKVVGTEPQIDFWKAEA